MKAPNLINETAKAAAVQAKITTAATINHYKSSGEHTESGLEMKTFMEKFQKIEEKNRCARVRFLDWLSVKLIDWGNKVKAMSDRIDSPCTIKLKG